LPDEQKARAAGQLSTTRDVSAAMPELRADAVRWMLENPPAATDAAITTDTR
jgi:hypothetical protein